MTKAPRSIDLARINAAALPYLPAICARLAPGGRREGLEWVAKNPTRLDRRAGSFKINLKSGRWPDFAANGEWGGLNSLVANIVETAQVYRGGLVAPKFGRELMGGEYVR